MEVLFSNIYNIKDTDVPPTIEMAALSNYFIKKLGFKTVFFGDERSLDLHKNIEYNEFKLIPKDFIKSMPKCFWSVSKLYSLQQTNKPCIHIDSDLFVTKPFPKDFLQNDVVCFHHENFSYRHMKQLQDVFIIKPKECEKFPIISYNCGVMGGQDFNSWHKAIDILFLYLIENKEYLDEVTSKYKINRPHFFYPPVLFEQIWLFQILKFLNKNKIAEMVEGIKCWKKSFMQVTRQTGYIHLMKTKIIHNEKWKYFLKYQNIKC